MIYFKFLSQGIMISTKNLEELDSSINNDMVLLIEQQNTMRQFIIEQLQTLTIKDEGKLLEYVDFCIINNKQKHTKRQTEKHHILLSSIFKQYSDLNIHKWNSTFLTYSDHYLAHSLFAEAIGHNSAVFAWWNMNSQNKTKVESQEDIIGPERYKELRQLHYDIVSQLPHLKNKSEECIQKRKTTLSTPDENGVTGFQKNAQKISQSLIERGSLLAEKNPVYNKNIIKDRKNPEIRFASPKDFDRSKYVPIKMGYILLYDNTGELYFHGWRDECIEFCNSIGLDGRKVPAGTKNCFIYDNTKQNEYIIKLMKLLGISKYINSKAVLITDIEAKEYINKKEGFR